MRKSVILLVALLLPAAFLSGEKAKSLSFEDFDGFSPSLISGDVSVINDLQCTTLILFMKRLFPAQIKMKDALVDNELAKRAELCVLDVTTKEALAFSQRTKADYCDILVSSYLFGRQIDFLYTVESNMRAGLNFSGINAEQISARVLFDFYQGNQAIIDDAHAYLSAMIMERMQLILKVLNAGTSQTILSGQRFSCLILPLSTASGYLGMVENRTKIFSIMIALSDPDTMMNIYLHEAVHAWFDAKKYADQWFFFIDSCQMKETIRISMTRGSQGLQASPHSNSTADLVASLVENEFGFNEFLAYSLTAYLLNTTKGAPNGEKEYNLLQFDKAYQDRDDQLAMLYAFMTGADSPYGRIGNEGFSNELIRSVFFLFSFTLSDGFDKARVMFQ